MEMVSSAGGTDYKETRFNCDKYNANTHISSCVNTL